NMPINWDSVTSAHVREACRKFDEGAVKCLHPPRNTFLVLEGKHYPAKFIRGVAYELATGIKLNPNVDFSGGAETARFFRKLGFRVDYQVRHLRAKTGHARPDLTQIVLNNGKAISNETARVHLSEKQQKQALEKLLEQVFRSVKPNHAFDWLVVPDAEG